jgi:hypothetical protein
MANLSELTRKDQVLAVLRERMDDPFTNGWVDGTDLANEQVGGSEGLKRLRELRQEGYLIQERAHPDRSRAIHQYRLVRQSTVDGDAVVTTREVPNGGNPVNTAAPRGGAVSHPPSPNKQTHRGDWQRESALTKEYRRVFWVRNPKQRLIGTVAADFDSSRWFWSVKRPKYKGKYGDVRPEKTLGSGIVATPGGAGMMAAMETVEFRIRELKEDKSW